MITVLMAARTSVEYMPHAIGSLLGQSYTDWHLVIGINGIQDQPAVARQAWNRGDLAIPNDVYEIAWNATWGFYSRVTLLNLPQCSNKGDALNRMMEHARGDYVAILDVDDLWHPLKLERQMPFVEMGYDVVGTAGSYFGDHQSSIGVVEGVVGRQNLQHGNCIINSSVVMRREHARWEPMDEPIEDYELWLRLAHQGRKMFNVGQHLTFIRQHAGNWSKQSNHEAAIAQLRSHYA